MPKLSLEVGLAVGGLILAILLVVFDKAEKLKGAALLWLLLAAALMTLPLALGNPLVEGVPSAWKWWLRGVAVALVGFSYWATAIWIWPVTKVESAGNPYSALRKNLTEPPVLLGFCEMRFPVPGTSVGGGIVLEPMLIGFPESPGR